MTTKEIRERLKMIEVIARDDDEGAHTAQDQLYKDFIQHVAAGMADFPLLAEQAAMVLKVEDIKFARWCA